MHEFAFRHVTGEMRKIKNKIKTAVKRTPDLSRTSSQRTGVAPLLLRDGATSVTFASAPDPSTSGGEGKYPYKDGGGVGSRQQPHTALVVSHNGRKFTAMDTLGLSSVGLSTKVRAHDAVASRRRARDASRCVKIRHLPSPAEDFHADFFTPPPGV